MNSLAQHRGWLPGIAPPAQPRLPIYGNPLRQLFSASTWRATWYLLAYLVVGWVLFSLVLAAGIATLALAITLAGLPLLIVTAAVIRGCATAERLRLRPVIPGPLAGGYRDSAGRGLLARIRVAWTDPATWRNLAYLGGLFPLLWALDLTVLTIWLAFIGCVALPAWYWAPEQTYRERHLPRGRDWILPERAARARRRGHLRRHAGKAIAVAVGFLVLSVAFQYVVVLTGRLHAWVAYSLLRAPEDPLAEAKNVLDRPGPLGPLHTPRRNGNSGRSAPAI